MVRISLTVELLLAGDVKHIFLSKGFTEDQLFGFFGSF